MTNSMSWTGLLLLVLTIAVESFPSTSSSVEQTVNGVSRLSSSFDWYQWQVGQNEWRRRKLTTSPANTASTNLVGTCFEEYWDSLPSLSEHSSANEKEVVLRIDGDSFQSRMACVKYLIQDANREMLKDDLIWGNDSMLYHWGWAYGSQLDWQQRSGRYYSDENTITGNFDLISPESWWSYMNFGFSVAIVAGSVDAANSQNSNKKLRLEVVGESANWLETPTMQKCVEAWKHLFQTNYSQLQQRILDLQASPRDTKQYKAHLGQLRFDRQRQVWEAHTTVMNQLLPSSEARRLLQLLSPPDAKVGMGWANMVEILASSNFPTDLKSLVEDGAGFLPTTVITDEYMAKKGEVPICNGGLSAETPHSSSEQRELTAVKTFVHDSHYRVVQSTHQLADMSTKQIHQIAEFWRRVVRTSPKVSRGMPDRVNKLVHGSPIQKMKTLLHTLWLALRPF